MYEPRFIDISGPKSGLTAHVIVHGAWWENSQHHSTKSPLECSEEEMQLYSIEILK